MPSLQPECFQSRQRKRRRYLSSRASERAVIPPHGRRTITPCYLRAGSPSPVITTLCLSTSPATAPMRDEIEESFPGPDTQVTASLPQESCQPRQEESAVQEDPVTPTDQRSPCPWRRNHRRRRSRFRHPARLSTKRPSSISDRNQRPE